MNPQFFVHRSGLHAPPSGDRMEKVAFGFGRWGACVAAIGAAACGVSVTQPISGAVGSTVDAADPDSARGDVLTQGLVAYWKLDESGASDTIIDSSGKGHTGTPVNNPLPSTSVPPIRFRNPSSRAFD